ncbi:PspA/IM30 family protein [Moraxella bovis]|uniref:PspA/IM30 family protein n=1 Tax=Moraxella bovis TaxID=476 RepID=UPI002226EEFE|nr:PspA/IM30 family protein [Moraxella bovis]UYZ67701.1 PspA/IM30 family protein [Moraxella bovis]UYZ70074.1 PspA/IM30 family protein [Moraxella bovis]UYZ74014.1 PspA/IM30 family protein [Moraxella bovis]UZA13365.1 PspA/IM30 family protein [Moraxella bovis]UZA28281.1 PspA/IM30 family protein [Moraxella bovis]
MSETLSYRVGRLVSGGFHAMLDKAEDLAPMLAFNENLRELDKAIDEVRGELGKVVAQKHLASKKLNDENTRHESLNDSIMTAVNVGRDDLAQVGIAEQMDIEARIPVLENTIAECNDKEKELEGFIIALQAKRREISLAIEQYQQTVATSGVNGQTVGASSLDKIAQRADKASNAFDRTMSRQTGMAHNTNGNGNAQSLKELEELARNNRIAERLAQLKMK